MKGELRIESVATAQRQVADFFRGRIRSGALVAGDKLPTQQALSQQLGVSGATIHFAFQSLVDEGLLVARRGCGTFVAQKLPGLRTVGICYDGDALTHPEHAYLRALHTALLGDCREQDLSFQLFHDPRPQSDDVAAPADLLEAVAGRQVDALVVLSAGLPTMARLSSLDLPMAYHSSADCDNAVGFDGRQFIDLAMTEVQAAGCRRVGLISGLPTRVSLNPFPGVHAYVDFTRYFLDRAGDLGLAIRDGWIREPRHEDELTQNRLSQEEYGFNQAQALLSEPELPEALIVYPDTMARGVITALLTAGSRAAGMKLVLHKNAEVPLLCPLPARFIVSRAADVARELLGMVERQFKGQPAGGPVHVPFQVE